MNAPLLRCPYCDIDHDLKYEVYPDESAIMAWCKWCRASWWVRVRITGTNIPEKPGFHDDDPPEFEPFVP